MNAQILQDIVAIGGMFFLTGMLLMASAYFLFTQLG